MINDEHIKEYMSWTEVMMECRDRNDESAENYCLDILDKCWYDMSAQERGVVNMKVLNLYSDRIP